MKHCIEELILRYPQMLLPIKQGIKDSEEYRNVVLKGMPCSYKDTFVKDSYDALETFKSDVGDVEILLLRNREDFVHALRALGNRCEPVDVPDSTGAITIFGLNNWQKVRQGLDDYKDNIIILSSGNYSNVSNDDVKEVSKGSVDLTSKEWIDASIVIRKYHELTHFIMRKKYPNDIKPIRDELIADSVGIIAAFGYFDERLLKLFLGIENNAYRKGGRLENYESGSIDNVPLVLKQIDGLKNILKTFSKPEEIWNDIERIMEDA